MARRINDILEAIRSLTREERNRLAEQLRLELDEEAPSMAGAIDPGAIIGVFADGPDLIDEVCESAMQSGERDPLRLVASRMRFGCSFIPAPCGAF